MKLAPWVCCRSSPLPPSSSPIDALGSVDWTAIAGGIDGLLTVPLIATLALLLNVTGLELIGDSDADLNRDRSTLAEIFGADLWEKLEPHLVSFEIEAGGQLIDHGEGSVGSNRRRFAAAAAA